MRQHSRNLLFGIAICIFVLVSIALYNSIDAKDQTKKAFIEQEKIAVYGLNEKLKKLEDEIKANDNVIVKMRGKLQQQQQRVKDLANEKDPIVVEEKEGVLQLPKKADQIAKEEENVEQAAELAKEEAQARKGVLLPPRESKELEEDVRRGGKVAVVQNFLNRVGYGDAKIGDDVCSARITMSRAVTDVQMLDVYEFLSFDDPDGGVWKQGWPVTYDEVETRKQKKLEVIVTPHSHTDPGWIKTYEEYYHQQTKNILDAMLTYLLMYKDMRFVYAEISFFEQWWADIDDRKRENVKKLLKDGNLELLTGGWVMSDEANSHYYAIISQLIEGHEWIRNHIGEDYAPQNHWSIDPFGLSPTLSYIAARSNLSNAIVQRVHYAVKKHFARNKQLEFSWRQMFSRDVNEADLTTHVMPFFSYDVPHTCGPDPKICCQFDFRRLPEGGMSCPWNVPPVVINEDNVAQRAEMLYDQYRKKAQLFRTNVVFVPLGDDFRYDVVFEWEQQYSNYRKLFDYMNSKDEWNVHARFGTPADYFKLMHQRLQDDNETLPVLSGDFFTYSDRNDHYWSGYYTSRPFYKQMDRTLQHYLRSAEILYSLAKVKDSGLSSSGEIFNLLVEARRNAGLFQHHDGVTGTAKDYVMVDYGKKILTAIKNCEQIISIAGELLLHEQSKAEKSHSFFDMEETRSSHDALPVKITANENNEVILFNSLAQDRNEVVCIHVKSAGLGIKRANAPDADVIQQIGPVLTVEGTSPIISNQKYELCFEAFIPAFGFEKYILEAMETSRMKASVRSSSFLTTSDFVAAALSGPEIVLKNDFIAVTFDSATGFIKSITSKDAAKTSVELSFVSYGARGKNPGMGFFYHKTLAYSFKGKFNGGDDLSGAYLFLPDGPAKPLKAENSVIVIEGPVMKKVVVISDRRILLDHTATLFFNAPYVQLQNLVKISGNANFEIAMRLQTDIKSGEYLTTDLNGFQMIRRRRFSKLPLQAQFYPMPGAAFIEDAAARLSLLGAQANGVASLESGWLEVMLDRRLMQDDGRGLFSGVTDNIRTVSTFRLFIEPLTGPDSMDKSTINFHSLPAHYFSFELHYPVISIFADIDESRYKTYSGLGSSLPCDMHVVTLRTMAAPTVYGEQASRSHLPRNSQALIVHRLGVDCRSKVALKMNCTTDAGKLHPLNILKLRPKSVTETSLTLLFEKPQKEKTDSFLLKPMDLRTFRLDFD